MRLNSAFKLAAVEQVAAAAVKALKVLLVLKVLLEQMLSAVQ
jgi:hypothetical protein